ncbi:HTH domain-containing protein [Halorientalis marina]|uniref:HTH domain-containing protein n=1 Tax=Halorientalis marina TaxID=2931976 RepID=UPI001FF407E2|nr:HTH domain-containing protein [Halorientalis marina]
MAGDRPRIELFLRSLAPATGRDGQERIVERLRTLDEENVVRDFEVVLCGECVCPQAATAETEPGERLLTSYEAFEAWADDRDRELSGFEQRDTKSILTGTTVTGIVFPRVVLAEYRDGDLTFVAPSADDTEKTSVSDRLSAYESGEAAERASDEAQREPRAEDATVDEVEE